MTGTVLLGLTGVAHTLGQLGSDPPALVPALTAMRGSSLPMGLGMAPSIFDIFRDLAFTMSITFFALTAMNLLLGLHRDVSTRLRRAGAGLNLIWIGSFIALNWTYRVPPPLISAIVVWPVFLVAYVRSRH
jgi:hypothetical protein